MGDTISFKSISREAIMQLPLQLLVVNIIPNFVIMHMNQLKIDRKA